MSEDPSLTNWQIDHIFTFASPRAGPAALAALGLVESYRRRHPGQGTANACYCFDNAYVELLWPESRPESRAEMNDPAIAPTALGERADWRGNGACPFGIALRPAGTEAGPFPLSYWDYRPPYLPDGMSIPVAEVSRDPAMPFVFQSPGGAAPIEWPADRGIGERQRPAGWTEIQAVELTLASADAPDDLRGLAAAGLIDLHTGGGRHRLRLGLGRVGGGRDWLTLPDLILSRA